MRSFRSDLSPRLSVALLSVLLVAAAIPAQSPDRAVGAELFRQFAGSDDTDAFLGHPGIRRQLERLLGPQLEHLQDNLNVRGSVDVIGGWLSVDGNAPHQGTLEEAVVCVSPYNLQVSAAILSQGSITAYTPGGTYDNLPRCVKDWITLANSGHKDRLEQPQNVSMAPGR
jgi:hypothetical protein